MGHFNANNFKSTNRILKKLLSKLEHRRAVSEELMTVTYQSQMVMGSCEKDVMANLTDVILSRRIFPSGDWQVAPEVFYGGPLSVATDAFSLGGR